MAKSDYTQKVADAICERLADGESLNAICAGKGMPNKSTVFRWLRQHEAFKQSYALAREAQAEAMLEEIFEIADDASNDTTYTENGERANSEWIQRSRLRVDARKWAMSKLMPKKYGDKVTQEHTGADGGPIDANITVTFVRADG